MGTPLAKEHAGSGSSSRGGLGAGSFCMIPAIAAQGPVSTGRAEDPKPLRLPHMETAMARIAGVNIPTNKRVVIALQYIHGIGPTKAKEITEKVGIPAERRVNQLTDAEVLQIREAID